ncbi:MAG: hypothetical protein RSE97_08230, partial [Oscillospiraceae bacterium]
MPLPCLRALGAHALDLKLRNRPSALARVTTSAGVPRGGAGHATERSGNLSLTLSLDLKLFLFGIPK